MAFFKQESATTGTVLPNGTRVTLDFILDDTGDGYISTDVGFIVNQVRAGIASRTGGWVEISEADYQEAFKKKASPSTRSPAQRRKGLNAGMFQSLRASPVASAEVPAAKPDPIAVPTPEQMKLPPRPKVGKLTK